MRKNTMIELVTELEKLSGTPYIGKLIELAKAGQFHDYRSKSVCGKHYFLECADHVFKHDKHLPSGDVLNLKKIRQDIIEGEYDETLTDEDRAIIKEECLNDKNMSEENRRFFFAGMGIK
jgi:hypothetical protein